MAHRSVEFWSRDPNGGEDSKRQSPYLDRKTADESLDAYYVRLSAKLTADLNDIGADYLIIKGVLSKGTFILFDSRKQPISPIALEAMMSTVNNRAVDLAVTGNYKNTDEVVAAMQDIYPIKGKWGIETKFRKYIDDLCSHAGMIEEPR